MNRLIFYVTVILLSSVNAFAFQSNHTPEEYDFKELSTAEYDSDFDSLIHYINAIDSFNLINDELKGQNFSKEIAKLRKMLPDSTDDGKFLSTIQRVLNLLQDNHASIIKNSDDVWVKSLDSRDTLHARRAADYYGKLYKKLITDNKPEINLPVKYLNGEYKVYHPINFNGTKIDSGSTIITINGMEPNKYISESYSRIPDLLYDIENENLYKEKFYQVPDIYEKGVLKLGIQDHLQKYNINFNLRDSLNYIENLTPIGFNGSTESKKVLYLEEKDVLYIKMPLMMGPGFYKEKLINFIKKDIIPKKVVFDIRGNGGGIDFVWTTALRMISPDTLTRSFHIGYKSNPIMDTLATRTFNPGWFTNPTVKNTIFTSRLLNNTEYKGLIIENNNITSDSINLGYKGPIFILADRYHYSSTGNFLSLAKANENIISIGMKSGRFSGIQFSPVQVTLPKSKITLRFEPVLDFWQVNSVKDLYHNYIDIKYEYTVKDLYRLATLENSSSSSYIDFLLHHDPLMQIVYKYKE